MGLGWTSSLCFRALGLWFCEGFRVLALTWGLQGPGLLGFRGLGFRVWSLGLGVWGLGFRVWGLGFLCLEKPP